MLTLLIYLDRANAALGEQLGGSFITLIEEVIDDTYYNTDEFGRTLRHKLSDELFEQSLNAIESSILTRMQYKLFISARMYTRSVLPEFKSIGWNKKTIYTKSEADVIRRLDRCVTPLSECDITKLMSYNLVLGGGHIPFTFNMDKAHDTKLDSLLRLNKAVTPNETYTNDNGDVFVHCDLLSKMRDGLIGEVRNLELIAPGTFGYTNVTRSSDARIEEQYNEYCDVSPAIIKYLDGDHFASISGGESMDSITMTFDGTVDGGATFNALDQHGQDFDYYEGNYTHYPKCVNDL